MAVKLLPDRVEQLDRLFAQNRYTRTLDDLLVKLRRDAVRDSAAIGQAVPPAPALDLFANETKLPEIDASQLTPAHLACGLRWHGALVVRGLASQAHLQTLTALLNDKIARTSAAVDRAAADRQQIIDSIRKGLPKMRCTPSGCARLFEVYEDVGVDTVVAEYFQERPVVAAERMRLGRQVHGEGLGWHQDGVFYGGVSGSVGIWLAITSAGKDAPALSVLPRRFDELIGVAPGERLPLSLDYTERLTRQVISEIAGDHSIASPNLMPGDALLLDEMTMHRTSEAPWRQPYKDAALTWCFAPSRFPSTGLTPLLF